MTTSDSPILEPDRLALVRDAMQALRRSDLRDVSTEFYEALFRRAPELRGMFRDDLGSQGMRFMGALGVLVEEADAPARMHAELRELGRGHAAYGVKAAHFAPMRAALMETLRERLGDDFPPAAEAAFGELYDRVADEMLAAAE